MKIKTRLLVLIVILIIPLVANLLILSSLMYLITQSSENVRAAAHQQAAALRMQAQLRNAEAALYRYQIEGEAGFVTQFETQLADFEQEVLSLKSQSVSPDLDRWVAELRLAHQQAKSQGTELIASRDRQAQDLLRLETVHLQIEALLSEIQAARSDEPAYVELVNELFFDIREMIFAVTSYLVIPKESERLQFTDTAITFRFHLDQLGDLDASTEAKTWSVDLAALFDETEALGSRLINQQDQQQNLFAQFAVNIFQLDQQIISGEIQPYAAIYLRDTQNNLLTTLSIALIGSGSASAASVVIALIFAVSNIRHITSGIQTLVDAADRIAQGNYQNPVALDRRDELQYLGDSFDLMMQQLAERQRRLQDLLAKLAIVQEEERRLVGLDLHDGVTQTLLSANMHLSTLASVATDLEAQASIELDLCKARLREAIAEIRWVVSELRPVELEDFGLVDGLRHYIAKIAERAGWKAAYSADLSSRSFDPAMETVVFRIVQEALSNAHKYAGTERVQVRLQTVDNQLMAEVRDWGAGFDIHHLGEADTLGLLGMRERAELFGGKLLVESSIGSGTCIKLSLPLAAGELKGI